MINCIYLQNFDIKYFFAICQFYLLYLLQYTYQIIIIKSKYQKNSNYLFENILDISYTKKKFDKKDIFYIIKKLNKVFINIFGLKLRYKKYKLIFFKFLLYKYLKSNCIEQN